MSAEESPESKVKVGDHAPDFTLPDQNDRMVSLKNLIGKKAVVLYFYPADFSRGCTAEACSFRDNTEVFKEAGAEVVGVVHNRWIPIEDLLPRIGSRSFF